MGQSSKSLRQFSCILQETVMFKTRGPGFVNSSLRYKGLETSWFSVLICPVQDWSTCRAASYQALSTDPCKADLGGSALNWLGAAQLEVGGSWPVRHNDFSHGRRLSVAFSSTTIVVGLITRNYEPSLLCRHWNKAGVTSLGHIRGQLIWRPWVARSLESPSRPHWWDPKECWAPI